MLYTKLLSANSSMSLVPQMQGDCGVFSFYYAARLRKEIDPSRPSVYPPKKRYFDKSIDLGAEFSIRQYAKQSLQSGQGEILTSAEMIDVITHFGYAATTCAHEDASKKQQFITASLKSDCPVMVAYWMGDNGPVTSGSSAGAHWSVIIGETGNDYWVINPWYPNRLKRYAKKTLLDSNAAVDSQTYKRFWEKTTEGVGADGSLQRGIHAIGDGAKVAQTIETLGHTVYDIGQGGRKQKLAHVLIAVQ